MTEADYIWKTTKEAAAHFGISEAYLRGLKDDDLPQAIDMKGSLVPTWRDLSFSDWGHSYRWNIVAIGYFFDQRQRKQNNSGIDL